MVSNFHLFLATALFFCRLSSSERAPTKDPEFVEPIANLSIPVGREAVVQCTVENLGQFKVAWIKIDTQTLLAIHTHVITRDSRIRISHSNNRQWYLHINSVQVEDQGYYMCQINTEPMVSQLGFIEVMVPPKILEHLTSSDTTVEERARVSLSCRADGYPTPGISWRREDAKPIQITTTVGDVQTVNRVEGDYLNMSQVMREDMGAYLCIASNGIPPSVSKRILLQVNFKPKIRVPEQLVGAAVGHEAELECRLEASPRPLTSWVRGDGLILLNSAKYRITETDEDWYRIITRVRISRLEEPDFSPYKCVAKNTFGEKEGYVRLYEMPPPTPASTVVEVVPLSRPSKEHPPKNTSDNSSIRKGFNFSPTHSLTSEENRVNPETGGVKSPKMEEMSRTTDSRKHLQNSAGSTQDFISYQILILVLSELFILCH